MPNNNNSSNPVIKPNSSTLKPTTSMTVNTIRDTTIQVSHRTPTITLLPLQLRPMLQLQSTTIHNRLHNNSCHINNSNKTSTTSHNTQPHRFHTVSSHRVNLHWTVPQTVSPTASTKFNWWNEKKKHLFFLPLKENFAGQLVWDLFSLNLFNIILTCCGHLF